MINPVEQVTGNQVRPTLETRVDLNILKIQSNRGPTSDQHQHHVI